MAGDAFSNGPSVIISEFIADNNRTLQTRVRANTTAECSSDSIAPNWNGDGEFDSEDLVYALIHRRYVIV
ncbi:MAG: hypothetical protein CMJ80_11575 [Planctomycetaceae bacterium]|nr:hypothetical protein [Planctomycetaceae bacterium]